MKSPSLISVLIPLFNKEEFIRASVESALAQSHANIEVLVIDDGSTDNSAERLTEIADPRLSVVSRSNMGSNATRNELLGMARGDYIQFLDADDLLDPTKLEKQVAEFTDDVDVVLCRYRTIEKQGIVRVCPGPDLGHLVESLSSARPVTIHVPLHRRSTLSRVGGFDLDLDASQEYELHLRLATSGAWGRVAMVDECLATYRKVDQSISSFGCRLYAAKAKALRKVLSKANVESDRDALAVALMNAGRHLARCGSSDATAVFREALEVSARSVEALPKRQRILRRTPRFLASWEKLEHQVLSVLGVR